MELDPRNIKIIRFTIYEVEQDKKYLLDIFMGKRPHFDSSHLSLKAAIDRVIDIKKEEGSKKTDLVSLRRIDGSRRHIRTVEINA